MREGDEYVINGSKTFISNGLIADLIIVVCKTDPTAGAKGVSLIVVEADRAGFRRGRKLEKVGQYAQDTAELFFDNVRVPVGNLLGEEGKGFAYLMGELPQERFSIAIAAASTAGAALEQTLTYVKERKAFDQTVWDFQNTKFKLADIKAQAVAVRLMIDLLPRRAHAPPAHARRSRRSPSSFPPRRCGRRSTRWCSCTAATATCSSTRLRARSSTCASRASTAAPAK